MNVALSRAKDKIIIVGNIEYAKNNNILREIMQEVKIIKKDLPNRRKYERK